MNIKILGAHHDESRSSRYLSLLVDGRLAIDAGSLSSGLSLVEQRQIKAILLSHQHYDHVRDVPCIAIVFYHSGQNLRIYTTAAVYQALRSHLLDGTLFPRFLELPPEKATIEFTLLEPGEATQIEGYSILPISVDHAVPTIGYQITATSGESFFYSADSGPGITRCWPEISPGLLIMETTFPNSQEENARKTGHLTPGLLKEALSSFRELKGYLPRVILVHMDPEAEEEIAREIASVSQALDSSITLAREGMEFHL